MTRRTDAASATASPDAHPRPTQGGPDDSLLLSVLLSRMDQGVRLDAPDGRPLRWNAAYERMFPELSPALRDGTAGPGHGGVEAGEDGEDAALRRRPDGRRYRCDRHDFPDGSRLSLWSEVSDPAAEGRNAQLSDLLERMDQGVIMVDADMKVLAINRRLLDLYDVPHDLFPDPRYEDYIRFSAGRGEYGPGDPEEHVRRKLALARRDDVPIYEHVRPGRGVVEVRTRRLPGGGFVKTYTDITARKRAEAELARKSEMLRQTLENIGQGIALLDADLRIVTYNRKLLDLLGIPEEMAARLPTLEDISRFQLGTRQILLPPDAPDFGDDVEAQVRYLMERLGRPERELTYARPQADGRFIEVHIVPLPDGGQVRTYTDITDRLIADEAVRQSREILKGVIDAIPALIDVRDRERRLQLVNRHYRDTYGIEPGDLEDGATPVAGGGSSAERLDRLVIETGRGIPFFEESHPDTEGRRRHWLTTKMPLTDEGGEVSHIVTVALDITARKRAEEELARKSALLQAVLESIGQGLSAFDDELRLVAWNRRFLELLGFPPEYGAVGRPFADFVRFNVDRGSYGPGDPEEQVRARVELAMQPVPTGSSACCPTAG
ncbi:hypothetical protein DEW08_14090 [Azospirillum thermophilum]|uniref:PAS domain S-box protein n=1 Tax=Azospirillum thermophilum TaxID=2202148 RepID=A0A2S2CS48_9PROT|nr:PAS-domain containing protein [Azospirillum thermophilum]AWK87200.1 hypothetical protein DEW08_14090 [Azospirillum thermophilum]